MDQPRILEPDHVGQVVVSEHAGEAVALHIRRWDGRDPDGHRIAPEARPFVLVHGLASNARMWDGVAAELAGAGHPVAAIDQRGHGRSSKPDPLGPGDNPYSMEIVTDDLRTLIESTGFGSSAPAPIVVGQSWGGNVVVELAARFPGLTAGVVGIDGGAIELSARFPDWDDAAEALSPPRLVGTPAADLEQMIRGTHPDWPEAGIQGALACFEVRADGTIAPWLTRPRHLLVLRGLWEHRPMLRFPTISDPVLLLGADTPGAAEWTAEKRRSLDAAAEIGPTVTVEWMAGDHDLHAQHPVQIAERLRTLT